MPSNQTGLTAEEQSILDKEKASPPITVTAQREPAIEESPTEGYEDVVKMLKDMYPDVYRLMLMAKVYNSDKLKPKMLKKGGSEDDAPTIAPSEEPTLREKASDAIQDVLSKTLYKNNPYKARKIADTLVGGPTSNLPLGVGVGSITPAEVVFATQEGGRNLESGAKKVGSGDVVGGAIDIGAGALDVASAYPAVKLGAKGFQALGDKFVQAITGNPKATGAKVIEYASQMAPLSKIDIGPRAKTWNKSSADIFQKKYKEYVDQGMTHDQANRSAWKDSQVEGKLGEAGTLGTRFLPGHGLAQEVTDRGFKTELRPHKGKSLYNLYDKQAKAKYGKGWYELTDDQKVDLHKAESESRVVKNVSPHPELLKAYPEIGDYPAQIRRSSSIEGGFAPMSKYYNISGPSAEDRTSGALHELQHAVQHLEGWPTGSSPSRYKTPEYSKKTKNLQDEFELMEYALETKKRADRMGMSVDDLLKQQDADIAHLTGGAEPNLSPRIKDMMSRGDLLAKTQPLDELRQEFSRISQEMDRTPLVPTQAYRQTMGEGQARMAENRRKDLSDEMRKYRFPEDSYDFDTPVRKLRYDENLLDSPKGYVFPDDAQNFNLGGVAKKSLKQGAKKLEDLLSKMLGEGSVVRSFDEPKKEFVDVGMSKNPAGKSKKQWEAEQQYKHDIEQTHKFSEPKQLSIEDLQGSVLVPIPGDRTITGANIKSVAGVPLREPATMYGGPSYGHKKADEGLADFWASNAPAARAVQDKIRKAGESGKDVYGMYVSMAPESGRFALHNADALIKQLDAMNPSKKQVREFDKLMRERFPDFAGLKDPDLMVQLRGDAEMRKYLVDRMEKPTISTALDLPSGLATRHAITEPGLRDTPTGLTGFSVGKMKPSEELAFGQYYSHPTYDTKIPGEYAGRMELQLPWEYYFPDVAKKISESPKHREHAFGTFKAAKDVFDPTQEVNQEMIDNIMMLNELAKQRYSKGGKATKTKSTEEIWRDDEGFLLPPDRQMSDEEIRNMREWNNRHAEILSAQESDSYKPEPTYDDGEWLMELDKADRGFSNIRRLDVPRPRPEVQMKDYPPIREGMDMLPPNFRIKNPELLEVRRGGLARMAEGGQPEMPEQFGERKTSRPLDAFLQNGYTKETESLIDELINNIMSKTPADFGVGQQGMPQQGMPQQGMPQGAPNELSAIQAMMQKGQTPQAPRPQGAPMPPPQVAPQQQNIDPKLLSMLMAKQNAGKAPAPQAMPSPMQRQLMPQGIPPTAPQRAPMRPPMMARGGLARYAEGGLAYGGGVDSNEGLDNLAGLSMSRTGIGYV